MNALTFVYLNVVNGIFTGAEYELYSGYYQAYLRKNGISTNQYINTSQCTAAELADDIVKSSCGRIVFFVGEYNYYISKIIVNHIRKRFPEAELIAIGPVVEYIRDHLVEDFPVDCFCTENEYSQLLMAAKMPTLSRNVELPSMEVGADEIPHPYSAGVIPAREVVNVGLLASRGCIGKCNFCSYGTKHKMFSPQSVAAELRFLYSRLGSQNIVIRFFDECFGFSKESAIAICKAIAEEHLPFYLFCWCRLDMLTDDLLCAFAEAGFRSLLVGLESASERVLESLGKLRRGDTPQDFLNRLPERIAFAKQHGIQLMVSVNLGLDGEETADAAETIRYAEMHHLKDTSINFMTVFPKSRLYEKYITDSSRVSESPTRLPLRTFYPAINMRLIGENQFIERAMDPLRILDDYFRDIAVDYYCNLQAHGEGLVPTKHHYTTLSEMQTDNCLLLGKNCLVSKVDSLAYGRIFCDERKPLKYEVAEYDANLKHAYDSGVYIENQLFLHEKEDYCYILVNQAMGMGRFRFRYLGNALLKKIELLSYNLNLVKDGCATFSYHALSELIFDDMGAFLQNCCGEAAICPERYQEQDVKAFYEAWNAEPLLSVYASVIIFLYKNKRLFSMNDKVLVYFHNRFKAFQMQNVQSLVMIEIVDCAFLYNTRSKHVMVLRQEEKAALLYGENSESSEYRELGLKLKRLMGIGE